MDVIKAPHACPPIPKEVGVRWFTEVWNERNTDILPQILAADVKGHLEGGQEIVGHGEFKDFFNGMLEALPNLKVEIINSLSDGDDACVLWQATAVHTGAAFGLAPTGKSVTFRGMTWFKVIDGLITEGWDCWNQGALFATLSGT